MLFVPMLNEEWSMSVKVLDKFGQILAPMEYFILEEFPRSDNNGSGTFAGMAEINYAHKETVS